MAVAVAVAAVVVVEEEISDSGVEEKPVTPKKPPSKTVKQNSNDSGDSIGSYFFTSRSLMRTQNSLYISLPNGVGTVLGLGLGLGLGLRVTLTNFISTVLRTASYSYPLSFGA